MLHCNFKNCPILSKVRLINEPMIFFFVFDRILWTLYSNPATNSFYMTIFGLFITFPDIHQIRSFFDRWSQKWYWNLLNMPFLATSYPLVVASHLFLVTAYLMDFWVAGSWFQKLYWILLKRPLSGYLLAVL